MANVISLFDYNILLSYMNQATIVNMEPQISQISIENYR